MNQWIVRTQTEKAGRALLIIGVPLLLAYGFGLIFIAVGVALWYFGRERCPSCKAYGKIRPVKSEIAGQERGFGIVTRTDVVRGTVGRRSQYSNVLRQERAPIVRTTTRVTYQCSNCQQIRGTKDFYSQAEDFSPLPREQTVIQREVLKIPCRYCRTLLDPLRDKKCPNCGAVVTP